jgi:type I restriction enzyme S subunit
MRNEWRSTTLGKFCTLYYGKGIDQQDYVENGSTYIYGTGGLIGRTNLLPQSLGPSIMIGRKGSINSPIFIGSDVSFRVIDTAYYLKTEEDIHFVYQLIKSINLSKSSEASGVPSLNRDTFYSIKVEIPSLSEQQKIASILRTWDDAIEKLEKIYLKEIKFWKIQRSRILSQFGRKFGFSTIGKMTKAIIGGGTPNRQNPLYWQGNIPWVSVKDLVSSVLSNTQEKISQEALKKSASKLIPAFTPIMATRMAVGKTVYFTVDVAINQDLKAFAPSDHCEARYLFHCLRTLEEKISTLGAGSTVNGVTLDVIRKQAVPEPDKKTQLAFIDFADSSEERIEMIKKLINLMKFQKRGLMQKLLTGKWQVHKRRQCNVCP